MAARVLHNREQCGGLWMCALAADARAPRPRRRRPRPRPQAVGDFVCSVKLHPEVTGSFTVVIQKEKNTQGGKKK